MRLVDKLQKYTATQWFMLVQGYKVLSLRCHTLFALFCVLHSVPLSAHAPPIEPNVRCTPFFAYLWYI